MINFRTLVFSIGLCMIASGLPQGAWAFGKKGPTHLMSNMGDSITAATFADTSTFLPFSIFQSIFGEFALDNPKTMILIENKKSYSWASGTWIDSHYNKLDRHLASHGSSTPLTVLNVAVPGSHSKEMLAQAQEIVDAMKSGKYDELTYVTLLVGANDVCGSQAPGGTENEVFRNELRAAFSKLGEIRQANTVKVMVSSIPNVPLLGRTDIKNHKTMGFFSCDFVRTHIFGYCQNPLHWQTEEELMKNVRYVNEKNDILREVVAEAARTYPGLELAFGESIHNHDVDANILAMDCFHPNKDGQSQLSEELWGEQPWFK